MKKTFTFLVLLLVSPVAFAKDISALKCSSKSDLVSINLDKSSNTYSAHFETTLRAREGEIGVPFSRDLSSLSLWNDGNGANEILGYLQGFVGPQAAGGDSSPDFISVYLAPNSGNPLWQIRVNNPKNDLSLVVERIFTPTECQVTF